ncbi:putative DNA-binding protein [Brevibacillus brevis NBRC 100599]|uniref:Putative DNA-binding protein n=1 Tax=Brevibacillus brevis (strain 47 / JCM 6285 / NBRC 100599) TaxID=358681 RepID=C0ZFJ6_BREBN|nr:helix-turn-helix transcriptional regulator [Brevibacillus brevis]BAH44555.1 putative DNA-binding protein [Brevibacillus brevis NBRC 100599]
MNLKEFGVFFARIREKSGYRSQRELADVSGVSHSTINRIEAGTHKTKHETLKVLATYLKDVTYEELLEKAGILEDTASPSSKKDKPLSEYESLFFYELEKLSEEDKQKALEHVRYLRYLAEQQK